MACFSECLWPVWAIGANVNITTHNFPITLFQPINCYYIELILKVMHKVCNTKNILGVHKDMYNLKAVLFPAAVS